MKLPTILLFLSVSTGICFSAETEFISPSDTTKVLDEVVVIENAAKAPIPLLPLDVKIIGSDIIDSSNETNLLPILQNRIPGMFVTERGIAGYGVSGGASGAVSIRGVGGGNKVLFLIDGQPQWAGIFGHSLPDTYVTNDVERVEVVSGPSSLLYGSGAMGGSVNLITRRASKEGVNGTVTAQAGSYATQKYGARLGYRHNNLHTQAAASYESTNGNRKGMDYWLANQYLNASYNISSHWDSGVNLIFTETKAHNPGSVYREIPLGMWAKQFRSTVSLFIKNHYEISSGGIQAYWNYGKHDVDDGLDSQNKPRTYLFHSKDYNIGITLFQNINPWSHNNLSVGIDFKHWGGNAYNTDKITKEESPIVDKHVNEIAGYAMMQQALFQEILSLNAGIRLEHSSQFGNQWIPQGGFIVRPFKSNRIKFNYAKGFRSPNIRELYMYVPRNPDLKPELMNNFEMEFRQWLFSGRLNLGLAFYYINGQNMIQSIMIDGTMKNINTGKFINKGFEIDASFDLNRDWSFTANYAYLHTSTRIVGAPKNKLFGEIDYHPGQWQFSIDTMGIWDLNTEENTQSYCLLNARAAYQFEWKTPLTVFVKGENLTATKYQINYGFPMPRATIMAGIEYKF